MRYAHQHPELRRLGRSRTMVDLAREAEAAGLGRLLPVGPHPLQRHAAAGAGSVGPDGRDRYETERVVIGPMVTPLPRRRPWVVARQAVSLDHLSNGRMILGVGLGEPLDVEFGAFGEPTELKVRRRGSTRRSRSSTACGAARSSASTGPTTSWDR